MQITRPVRAKRTFTQSLVARPERVFPLLCPVRETEWANGWNPRQVVTASGYVEAECVFVMPGEPQDSIWCVTRWDPQRFLVEFVKVTPGFTVGKIEIQLRDADSHGTLADISYSYTALSEAGARFVQDFTPEYYENFMREWEAELNYFLQTGRRKEKPI